jgi:hypothetical protein
MRFFRISRSYLSYPARFKLCFGEIPPFGGRTKAFWVHILSFIEVAETIEVLLGHSASALASDRL